MKTLNWLRLFAYAERETFVRQRALEQLDALLLVSGTSPARRRAPLGGTPSEGARGARPTPRRPRS